ncbi:LmeA family phospholipid-binding protein [Vampirovibrio chlorellavorus]|uniref:LmeA family phospholipid-binding protein n=1 Tax=Vampirovibrio chlorellavorus TaxID=758823 RepID=UPI0026F2A058|nr:LmeA family phospholipid-binding protein [Vampirovibrio chlorellavorus]
MTISTLRNSKRFVAQALLLVTLLAGGANSKVLAQNLPGQPTMAAPIKAGGIMALDLPDSSAQSVSLDIVKGRFSDYSVGRIVLTGSGIDFRNGTLQGLKANILEGDFDNLLVDKLSLVTPAFSFDTMQLLNNRAFVLSQPVTAQVSLAISESGINRFLANPKTLGKIEKSLQKQTGGLKLITFSNPNFSLLGGNKVKLNLTGVVAQGLAVPLEMTGKLALQGGQLSLQNLQMASGGNDLNLPMDVSKTFQDKINELIDLKRLGKNSMVIYADSMKVSGKTLNIDGHATLTKLQFGA